MGNKSDAGPKLRLWVPSRPSSFLLSSRSWSGGYPWCQRRAKRPGLHRGASGCGPSALCPAPLSALWAWSSKKEGRANPLSPYPIPDCPTLVPLSLRARSPATCASVPAQDRPRLRRFPVGVTGQRAGKHRPGAPRSPQRLVESGEPEGLEDGGSECQRDRGGGLSGERTRGRSRAARGQRRAARSGDVGFRSPQGVPGSPGGCARE